MDKYSKVMEVSAGTAITFANEGPALINPRYLFVPMRVDLDNFAAEVNDVL